MVVELDLGSNSSIDYILELSGVGRIVEDGADEEERRATRLDGWVAWGAEERVAEDL